MATRSKGTKDSRRGKEQRSTESGRSPLRVREERARVQGAVPSSFATAETNEQLKEKTRQTARERDPWTLEEKEHTQPQGEKELEQITCKSDVAEDTMSTMVKLAKDPLEPHDIGQTTSECLLMAYLQEKTGYTQRVLVREGRRRRHRGACQGGAQRDVRGERSHFRGDTVSGRTDQSCNGRARTRECVDTDSGDDADDTRQAWESTFHARSRTQSGNVLRHCRRGEKRRFVNKNDGEQNERRLNRTGEEGVGSEDQSPGTETQPMLAKPLPWRRCDRGESTLWLAASYLEAQGYKPRRGEEIPPLFGPPIQ